MEISSQLRNILTLTFLGAGTLSLFSAYFTSYSERCRTFSGLMKEASTRSSSIPICSPLWCLWDKLYASLLSWSWDRKTPLNISLRPKRHFNKENLQFQSIWSSFRPFATFCQQDYSTSGWTSFRPQFTKCWKEVESSRHSSSRTYLLDLAWRGANCQDAPLH